MHPGPPHFWFSSCVSSNDNILFRTTELPMDGFFFTAITILVLPMIVIRSFSASLMIFLKASISLKWKSGNVKVSLSSCAFSVLSCSLALLSIFFNSSRLYPLRTKSAVIFSISIFSVSGVEFLSIVRIIWERGTEVNTLLGWKLCGRRYRLASVGFVYLVLGIKIQCDIEKVD